jgi:lipopolysaccharide export system protein LptC
MRRLSRRLLAFAGAAAVAFGGWRLLSTSEAPPLPVGGEEARSDYYVTGAKLTRTDDQGRPEYAVTAERMTHRTDNDSWLLESPTMQLFTEAGAPWYGRAERGRIWADGKEAELLGEVRLWREGSPQNRPMTLETRDVYLRPQENYAETQARVVMRQQQSRLVGVGARVYLDEERYQLLSQVEGRYVPTRD